MNDFQYGTIDMPKIEKPETLSRAEMDARVEATRHANELARIAEEQARENALQHRIAESVDQGMAFGQSVRWGGGAARMKVETPVDTSRDITIVGPQSNSGAFYHADPNTIPVKVGGVELSADQARAWLADGSITRQQYSDAVTAAMQRFQPGYRHSFS